MSDVEKNSNKYAKSEVKEPTAEASQYIAGSVKLGFSSARDAEEQARKQEQMDDEEKDLKRTTPLFGKHRTVEFYKLRRVDADTGNVRVDVDLKTFFSHICLPDDKPSMCNLRINEDVYIWYDGEGVDTISKLKYRKFRMGLTKEKTGSGQIFDNEFRPIPMKGDLANQTFFAIFDDGVLAMEYNHEGAKTSALEFLIQTNFADVGFVRVKACLNVDIKEILKNSEIKTITYKVNPTNLDEFNTINKSYKLTQKQMQGDTSIGTVKVTTTAKQNMNLSNEAEEILRFLTQKYGEEDGSIKPKMLLERLKEFATFGGKKTEDAVSRKVINLTQKHVTSRQYMKYSIPYENHHIDSEKAYEALAKAYNEKKTELDRSVTYDEVYS